MTIAWHQLGGMNDEDMGRTVAEARSGERNSRLCGIKERTGQRNVSPGRFATNAGRVDDSSYAELLSQVKADAVREEVERSRGRGRYLRRSGWRDHDGGQTSMIDPLPRPSPRASRCVIPEEICRTMDGRPSLPGFSRHVSVNYTHPVFRSDLDGQR